MNERFSYIVFWNTGEENRTEHTRYLSTPEMAISFRDGLRAAGLHSAHVILDLPDEVSR